MSLHAIANHVASKGRGPDSMLIHMTPNEVQGLQALALKHGGSLTINPETGLPEAGFLKNLLPAIIGFGLNAFAPGFGSAIGSALGAGAATAGAIGTGVAVGGFEALRTGSLEKGLMAGLGAYGGAGMAGSLAEAGTGALSSQFTNDIAREKAAEIASGQLGDAEIDRMVSEKIASASPYDKLGAGFSSVTASPTDALHFAGNNWKYGLAAASPIIADAMVPTSTKMPTAAANPGYIRPYDFDPRTQSLTRLTPVKAGFKNGGLLALAGGGDPADDPNARFNTLSGQSKAAYDYLMGNTGRSFVQPPTGVGTEQTRPTFTSLQTPVGGTGTSSTPPNEVQTGTAGITGTGPIEPPVRPPIIDPFEEDNFNFPIDVDPYDQNNQDAIDKYEEEVGNEQYDQNNQDAIDKYEEEAANEQYDQNNQDAINKIEQEVTDEDETDERHGFINPNLPPEEEETTVNPTPKELINRDEFGNLDEVIADRAYDQNNEDAINKYEQEIRDENLVKEDPYGNLDAAIAENNAQDFRKASDIDDATISTDAATNNGAAEAAAREKEEAQRDEDRIINDYFGYGDYGGIAAGGGDVYGDAESYGSIAAGGGDVYGDEGKPGKPAPDESQQPTKFVPKYVDEGKPGEPAPVEETRYPYVPDYIAPPDEYPVEYTEDVGGGEYTGGGGGGYGGDENYGDIAAGGGDVYGDAESYGSIAAGGGDYGGDENYGDIAAGGGDYGGGGGDGGGYGGYDAYGGFEDYMNGYDPGYYGGGEGYSWNGEANGGLIGHAQGGLMAAHYARGGYMHPFFSQQTGKFNYHSPHMYANGGMSNLGGYSDGGRLLKGPGDGVSDSIPASIGKNRQPARLADGEFVVPARIVSELGNGSTEAGARKLYAMMDRIQKARSKTVGKNRVATNSRADKHLPA